MRKINVILLLVAMISLVGLGAVLIFTGQDGAVAADDSGLKQYQDGYIENTGLNKDIFIEVLEQVAERPEDVYDPAFQAEVRSALDRMIAENHYDEDQPLVAYNPFGTNSQSLYIYFETSEPYAIHYSVHVPDSGLPDFGGYAVPVSGMDSKTHEFQVTGLIPGEVNMITLRMIDADGLTTIRRFYYQNDNEVAAKEIFLEAEVGTKQVVNEEDDTVSTVPASEETLSNGLFVVFAKENDLKPYLRMYDNNGIQRAEIPLVTYGTKQLIVHDKMMYYRVSDTRLAGVNHLGQAEQIFTAGGYTFGEDYTLDKNNDLLVIASDKAQTSVDDCVLLLDRETGEITELFDLGDMLPEYKKTCKPEDGMLDWIGLNSISWEEGNKIVLGAEKANLIIRVRRLYNEPRIVYLLGDSTPFEGTPYEELFLRLDNDFTMHDGVNFAGILPYDKIRVSRHYIYLLNGNRSAEYEKKEEPVSYYYRYLVDEAEFGVRLMEEQTLTGVQTDGSLQWYQDHMVMTGDRKSEFYEYDRNFQLITKFTYNEPRVEYTEEELEYIEDHPLPDSRVLFLRVFKYDFYGYFFMEQPTIVVPVEEAPEAAVE